MSLIDIATVGFLIGAEIVSRLGYEMTGRLITEGKAHGVVIAALQTSIEWVVTQAKPRLLSADIFHESQARSVILLLPLVASTGDVEMVLGGWFFDNEIRPDTRLIGISVVENAL